MATTRARAHRASATNLTSSSSTTEIHDGAPPFARARIVAIPRRRPRNHIAIVVIHHPSSIIHHPSSSSSLSATS